jgi:hypothetical protein
LDKQLLEIDPCALFTADMLDRLPRPNSYANTYANYFTPSSAVSPVLKVMHSPQGVSIRALRLLQTIKHLQSTQKLNRVNTGVLYNLVDRIEREQSLVTGETHSDASAVGIVQDDASQSETTCNTTKPIKPNRMDVVCLFLRSMQTAVGQENKMMTVNGRNLPSRILPFEDLAANMKLDMNMSTSQRLSKLVEGLLRSCSDEVTAGHIRYMRASDIRKMPGMGRSGRKIHNHLLMTEYGLHRCRSIANELLLLHEASVTTFWKRWNASSE